MMMIPRRNDFDLLSEMFRDPFFDERESRVMKTDIKEKKDKYVIDIDLPGYEKENIKIEVEDGYLTVHATIDSNKEEKEEGKFVRKERYMGSCSRSFYVGDDVKEEDIKATFRNGILKLGKVTDFQAHQIEHQLGAYTNCNHGQGLAVIHPVLYQHIYQSGVEKFARYARVVWGIHDADLSLEETARKGIEALGAFIQEMGLPTTLTQMGITDQDMLRKVADSSNITAGCCQKLTHDEIYDILLECL